MSQDGEPLLHHLHRTVYAQARIPLPAPTGDSGLSAEGTVEEAIMLRENDLLVGLAASSRTILSIHMKGAS